MRTVGGVFEPLSYAEFNETIDRALELIDIFRVKCFNCTPSQFRAIEDAWVRYYANFAMMRGEMGWIERPPRLDKDLPAWVQSQNMRLFGVPIKIKQR